MGLFSRLFGCLERLVKRGGAATGHGDDDGGEDSSGLFFQLQTLQLATNFFSDLNQLGHGGFGPVYKGLMPDGQEIAVKKLSVDSRQGLTEFMNEVKLLLRTQHKNLVQLRGCCVEGPEKMLVYEYLPNRSLDYFLFDNMKRASLNWTTRFQIIVGVVRALLYLHEEAPERIIHRDIKASNILLDEKLNPKVSDFGLARLFPGEDTHLNTFRISGTHGYMAPEYAMRGFLSVKTDVFSFGILVLEMVSGRKNFDRRLGVEKEDLLYYAWTLFRSGRSEELVDSTLSDTNPDEMALCIKIGLLSCQASVAKRPDMNSIHLMLSSDSFTLPQPGQPALQGRRGMDSTTTTVDTSGNNTSVDTNGNTTLTGLSKTSGMSSIIEDYSRNSISYSSIDEGR